VPWDEATIRSFDVVLIATNHACVNYRLLAEWADCIVDTRNAMRDCPTRPGQVWKA
jgi:UDP-N-acetyl-D-glucosamine dehydrogenase